MTDQSHVSWAHHTAAGNRCAACLCDVLFLVYGSLLTVVHLIFDSNVHKDLACQ